MPALKPGRPSNRTVVIGLALWLSAVLGCKHVTPSAQTALSNSDEIYKVYAGLFADPPINHKDGNEKFVIVDNTIVPPDYINPQRCSKFAMNHPESFNQILADYEKKKHQTIHLERLFPLQKPYVLISKATAESFPGWGVPLTTKRNRETFAGVQDVFLLSNVFFDKNRTFAMVYTSTQIGWSLAGAWGWSVLERLPNGFWQIDSEDYCPKIVA